jgi:hypothetical protein
MDRKSATTAASANLSIAEYVSEPGSDVAAEGSLEHEVLRPEFPAVGG